MFETRKKDFINRHGQDISVHELASVDLKNTNLFYHTDEQKNKWIEESTIAISKWREIFSSTYTRWALAVKGLSLAEEVLSDPMYSENEFGVTCLRIFPDKPNELQEVVLTKWDNITTGQNYFDSINYLSEYGIVDIVATLEEFIFQLYKIYLVNKPEKLINSNGYEKFKKQYNAKKNNVISEEEWRLAWSERLNQWQQKKIYDGLKNIFTNYCNNISTATINKLNRIDVANWADMIDYFALIRNHLIHGATKVNEKLGSYHRERSSLVYGIFKEGDELKINFNLLKVFEFQISRLCSFLNESIFLLGFYDDGISKGIIDQNGRIIKK